MYSTSIVSCKNGEIVVIKGGDEVGLGFRRGKKKKAVMVAEKFYLLN